MSLDIKGYHLKVRSEALWALAATIATFLAQTVNADGFHNYETWHTYVWAIGVGIIRIIWGWIMSHKSDGAITWS